MKKKSIRWIIVIIVLVILSLIGLKRCGIVGDGNITQVAVDTVADRTIIEVVTASGKIYPETEVKIKPDVSGEIVELNIAEGDSVYKGQLLLKINPSIYSSAVTQAEASMNQSRSGVTNAQELVAQSKAQMDRAKANFNRNKQLFEDKIISRLEYEQLESEYLTSQASYEAARANVSGGNYGVAGAQANLSQARENLRRTTITAPNTGVVSQMLVKKGERVVGTAQMDGTQILTIADMGRMEVRVDVSETDISKVSLFDTAIIDVEAYRDRKFKGVVTKISVSSVSDNTIAATTASTEVTNYTVHILILPETYAGLRQELGKGKFPFKPGMSAGVEIQTRREDNTLSVPLIAVTTRDWPDSLKKMMKKDTDEHSKDFRQVVFVYNKITGAAELKDVETGLQDNEFIQITKGLKKGDVIISAPYNTVARKLEDKAKVKVVAKKDLWETKDTE